MLEYLLPTCTQFGDVGFVEFSEGIGDGGHGGVPLVPIDACRPLESQRF